MFDYSIRIPKPIAVPATEWLPYLINSFVGGLNTADHASSLRKDQFTAFLNYYFLPNGTPKVRGPFRPWLVTLEDTVLPDSAPPLTFKIVELRGSDYRVVSWDNGSNYEVSVYDETNDRWAGDGGGTSIKANLTDGHKVRFAKYSVNEAEDLIFCNGYDTPQRWVGTVDTASSDLGLTAPSDTTTLATSNSSVTNEQGIDFDGKYYYKFTAFYDSSGTNTKYGESGPTAQDDITVAGADISANTRVQATLSNCPAIPSGATRNFVYRSPPEEVNGPYRRVGYYTTGTGFVDKMPEENKVEEVPVDDGAPPKLKNIIVHDGRIWGIGQTTGGALTNKAVWSRRGSPDYFPALNYYYFPDPLIGPILFNKLIYWFTETQIWVTTNLDNPETSTVKICDIGCDSFDSITDVGNGLAWQFDGNIYWANFNQYNPLTGDLPWPIGDPIRNKIDDIPLAYRSNSAGVLHKGRYYLSISGPNQSVNTSTIVWDVKLGTILLREGKVGGWTAMDWKANAMQSFDGTLYTLDNVNKYIMEHDFAGVFDFYNKTDYDSNGYWEIITEIRSGYIHFGQEWAEKIVNSISAFVETSGVIFQVSLSFNEDEFVRTTTFAMLNLEVGASEVKINSDWLVWGQGTWDNFKWGASNFGLWNKHQKFKKGGKGKNVRFTITSTNSQDMNLVLFKLYYKILPTPS